LVKWYSLAREVIMRLKNISALFVFAFYSFFLVYSAFAQYGATDQPQAVTEEGSRYVLVTVNKSATYAGSYGTSTRKTPAIVLDTYLGILWRCKDIRDEKPVWIKNDLAKNTNLQLNKRRYIINIPAYTGEDYRIPAVVMDMDTGKTWTCSNITDDNATWVSVDLPKDITKEGYTPTPY